MDVCTMALTACGVAIVGMATYIKMQHTKIEALHDAQIARLEKQIEMLEAEDGNGGGS